MQEGSTCFHTSSPKNYFKNLNEPPPFFKYNNFLKVFSWEADTGVYLTKSITLQRSHCFFIKSIWEGVWKRGSLFFFFLEKQKQAVLLTVIDKAGRKKYMKYTLRLINTGKSI